jgi:hypothetical protein
MSFFRLSALLALGLGLGGCVTPPPGYWDARLAQMPLAFNYGCRNGLDQGSTQEAALYCPNDMPLPPNGVWRPGLSGQ